MPAMTWLWILLTAGAQTPICAPLGTAEVDTLATSIESDFRNQDLDTLEGHHATLVQSLPCLLDPVTPALALRVHQVLALAAWALEDNKAFDGHLCSISHIDPTIPLPLSVVASGSPLRRYASTLTCNDIPPILVEVPRGSTMWLDGVQTSLVPGVPADRPYVMQQRVDGLPVATAIIRTGETMAPLAPVHAPTLAGPASPTGPGEAPRSLHRSNRRTAGGIALGSGLVALGTGAALIIQGTTWKRSINDSPYELTEEIYGAGADGLLWGGIAAMAVGVATSSFGAWYLAPREGGVTAGVSMTF
jgi:hypothetical protein